MGRLKTHEERTGKRMGKKPMTLGNLAPQEAIVTNVDKEKKEVTVVALPTDEQKEFMAKGAAEEKQRILAKVFTNKELMTAEFKVLMAHTGSYLGASMAISYSRAFNDIIKLLLKGDTDEKAN